MFGYCITIFLDWFQIPSYLFQDANAFVCMNEFNCCAKSKSPAIAVILNLLIAGLGWFVGVVLCSYDAYQLAMNRPAPFDFLEKYVGE